MKVSQSSDGKYIFMCPGCKCGHWFDTKIWTFNGDFEKPTVRASILVKSVYLPPNADFSNIPIGQRHPDARDMICHSFITDGKIQFLSDCTHELAGQTVDLEDF